MRAASQPVHWVCQTSYRHAYWTLAQMVAHHTVNGCNLQPGDLLGTGTLSGPTLDLASEGNPIAVFLQQSPLRNSPD
jgi:fumarylacetoacetase